MTTARFRALVLEHYNAHGRHDLPWRKTRDPYRILVSEVMLQQTQVERVIPYYKRFLKEFPNARVLAEAPLSRVLTLWQGLGYNRRAKMLHEAARAAKGRIPATREALLQLPGVGPYTAGAVAAFAGNEDGVFIETNIRTAVLHHFFPDREQVPDNEIFPILEKALPKGEAREWYSALMDYGTYLKRSGVHINTRSAHYTKQKQFKGSGRQARGAILRALLEGSKTARTLTTLLGTERKEQLETQLAALLTEGLVEKAGSRYQLPG